MIPMRDGTVAVSIDMAMPTWFHRMVFVHAHDLNRASLLQT
jgi:hypothetical protein